MSSQDKNMLGASTMKIGTGQAWKYADQQGPPRSRTPTGKRSSPGKQQQTPTDVPDLGASKGLNDMTAELKKLRSQNLEDDGTADVEEKGYYRNVRIGKSGLRQRTNSADVIGSAALPALLESLPSTLLSS